MDALAIVGLAALLLVKEAGVPIPVPGDLLVIGAGVSLAGDPPVALAVLAVILTVGYLGGAIQFLIARRVLRGPLLAALDRIGIGAARVESLADRLRRSGARGVAIARMTPGVRIGATAAAGIAAIPFAAFLLGLVVGNGVFVAGHFALGYLLGASATELVAGLGMGGLLIIGGVLALLGAVAWLLLRRRNRAAPMTAATSWADACCPACLTAAVIVGE